MLYWRAIPIKTSFELWIEMPRWRASEGRRSADDRAAVRKWGTRLGGEEDRSGGQERRRVGKEAAPARKGRGRRWKLNPWGGWKLKKIKRLWRARSRLYRRRFLRPNTHFSAFFEIYTICTLLHRSNLKISAKFRQIFYKISAFSIKIYSFSSFFR